MPLGLFNGLRLLQLQLLLFMVHLIMPITQEGLAVILLKHHQLHT